MSLSRLNAIVMSNVLPFNFGMDYEAWVKFWNDHPTMRDLVGSDPATWTPEVIAQVNQRAKEETALADRLMALSNEDFHAELDRLAKEVKDD